MMNSYRDYTNANSKGHDRLKRSARIMSITLYLFLASLLICGILVAIG